MKERIEQKLGCSIESYVDYMHSDFKKNKDYEIEQPSYFTDLTDEELDFVISYIEQKIA